MKRMFVDGTNLAHIHFAANPSLTSDGAPAGIIKGFISAIYRLNRMWRPDQIVVFFDGPGGSVRRREIYKEYKEGRRPRTIVGQQYQFDSAQSAEKNYDWQVGLVSELLECCAINVITTKDYETDDGIAYSIQLANNDDEILIVSCDKDFYQLINERVQIYNPTMKSFINKEWVLKKFDVHPNNWLFYRSIDGDVSDNIPGVKGFGPKTLKKLFAINSEKIIEVDSIPASVRILSENTLSAKEKRLLKRLEQLNSSIDLIRRNQKIMNLKEPLISMKHKEQLEYQLDFSGKINMKDFCGKIIHLGLEINPMMPNEFVRLKKA